MNQQTPEQQFTLDKLMAVETKLDELTALIDAHMHALWDGKLPRLLLVGWKEITRAVRRTESTLRRYVRKENFPVCRWGRHVVTTPTLIEDWLLTREAAKRERRWKPHPDSYGGPRKQRPREKQVEREAAAVGNYMLAKMTQSEEKQ